MCLITTRITDPVPLVPDIERRRPEAHSPSVALSTQSQATVQLIKRDPVGRIPYRQADEPIPADIPDCAFPPTSGGTQSPVGVLWTREQPTQILERQLPYQERNPRVMRRQEAGTTNQAPIYLVLSFARISLNLSSSRNREAHAQYFPNI